METKIQITWRAMPFVRLMMTRNKHSITLGWHIQILKEIGLDLYFLAFNCHVFFFVHFSFFWEGIVRMYSSGVLGVEGKTQEHKPYEIQKVVHL